MKLLYITMTLLICGLTLVPCTTHAGWAGRLNDHVDVRVKPYNERTSRADGYASAGSVWSINIKTFTAYKKGKVVYLKWTINNREVFNNYGIELSKNGKEYTNIGISKAASIFDNNEVSYEYEYQILPEDAGKLFFRIKQINQDNKSLYSEVRMVSIDQDGDAAYRPYPNPTVQGISILFDKILEGTYDVILSDNAGKVSFRKTYTLAGTNIISVEWPQKLLAGIYYLHTTDKQNNVHHNARIIVN